MLSETVVLTKLQFCLFQNKANSYCQLLNKTEPKEKNEHTLVITTIFSIGLRLFGNLCIMSNLHSFETFFFALGANRNPRRDADGWSATIITTCHLLYTVYNVHSVSNILKKRAPTKNNRWLRMQFVPFGYCWKYDPYFRFLWIAEKFHWQNLKGIVGV